MELQVARKTVGHRIAEPSHSTSHAVCPCDWCSDGDLMMSLSVLYNPKRYRYTKGTSCTDLIAVSREAAAVTYA